jgi:hypothetical protein
MPMLIPAAIAWAATSAAVGAGIVAAGTLAAAAVGFAAYAVTSYAVSMNQKRKAEKSARNAWNAQVQDRAVIIKSGDYAAPSIYGTAMVGGVLVHAQSTGSKGEFLHLVIGISRREIDAIEGVYFNGELLPTENLSTGFVESGNFTAQKMEYAQQSGPGSGTTITLANTPTRIVSVGIINDNGANFELLWTTTEWVLNTDYTVAGNVVTLLGGKTATTAVYVSYEYAQVTDTLVRIRKVLGMAGQVAFSELVSESGGKWTANHIGVGCAAVYIRIKYDNDVFGQIGIPEIKFRVRGFKVYDPRMGTTLWSQNAALCTADYLKDATLGVGAAAADVPDSEVTAAANICDEDVNIAVSTFTANASTDELTHSAKLYTGLRVTLTTTTTLPGGLATSTSYYVIRTGATTCKLATSPINAALGTAIDITSAGTGTHTLTAKQLRYTVNGLLYSDVSPKENLGSLTDAMAGVCVWTAGRWLVRAGAGRTSEFTINTSYLADDAISIRPKPPRRELFNAVTGVFIDPSQGYTPVQFSAVENATYRTADGGRRKARDLSFPLSDDNVRSQRLAKIALERARQGMLIKIACNYLAYDLVVSDWVTLDIPRYFGGVPKVFEVVEREWDPSRGLVYTLQETAAAVYDWAYGEATTYDLAPNTALPNPYTKPGLISITSAVSGTNELIGMADGTVVTRVLLTWTQSSDVFVVQGGTIQIQYSRPLDPGLWTSVPNVSGADTSTYIVGAPDGVQIVIRIRAVNSSGRIGAWQYYTHTVVGKSMAPSDVAGLTTTKVTNGLRIDWTACPDPDYLETELRRGGTGWADAVPLVGIGSLNVRGNSYLWVPAAGTYVIRAKHRDTTGNVSVTAASTASITVSAADLLEWVDIAGRPAMFRVAARGNFSSTHPVEAGLYNGETGGGLVGGSRSYTLVKLSRSTGAIAFSQYYDVFNAGAVAPNRLEDLVTDLGTATSSQIVVIFTFDEPQGRRTLAGLPAAMYRNGASQAIFGSPQFKYRSAYILVGIGGCGEGNGFESYSGDADSSTSAWCDVSFYLQNSQLVISGSAATPRTLADYSYTGALNATYGATWSSNITSQPADSALMNSYVSTGINLLYNSTFDAGLEGWSVAESSGFTPDVGVNFGTSWRLYPYGPWSSVLYMQQLAAPTNSNWYYGRGSAAIPVKGNTRYILSGYVQAHRCNVALFIRGYNSDGGPIGALDGAAFAQVSNFERADGKSLDKYTRIAADFTSTADCAYVIVYVRKYDTLSGTSSYLFATRLQLEEASANGGASAWSDSARQHAITASNIGTYVGPLAIDTTQMAANAATYVFTINDAGPHTYTSVEIVQLTGTYTPPVDCKIVVTTTWSHYTAPVDSVHYGVRTQIVRDSDVAELATSAWSGSTGGRLGQSGKLEYDAVGGVAIRIRILGKTSSIAIVGTSYDLSARVEVIKK